MATHSSILACKIPWTEEPEGATVHGVTKELDTTEHRIGHGVMVSLTVVGLSRNKAFPSKD